MELARPLELFGRKENRSRKILFFANTFLRKPLAILFPACRRDFAQTLKNFCSWNFCWQFAIIVIEHNFVDCFF